MSRRATTRKAMQGTYHPGRRGLLFAFLLSHIPEPPSGRSLSGEEWTKPTQATMNTNATLNVAGSSGPHSLRQGKARCHLRPCAPQMLVCNAIDPLD